MHVVATAGHVDHGKSTLVRALTGQDPDRLAEEHRRGVSIELGYVWTTLDPVGDVAFVDVPGHEKFIATTLAGLGPAGVVLLVVAADDGWMPQSAEHLAALAALGVRRGVLVVTRADLADPGPALASARAELAGTSRADIPQVAVSARTGQGLDCLRSMLTEVLAHTPTPVKAATRLWVDRRFTVRGSGTVVTGTLESGVVEVGRDLTDGRTRLRVRGVEALRTARGRVEAPARVALNLGAGVPDDLDRGSAVVGFGEFELTDLIDVSVARDSRLPAAPLAHLGAAQVAVRTRPLGEHHFRLHLERPLPLHLGDRGLLRDPGSRQLWGFQVVDPAPPALRRRG
ncbi:MAG: GTP-binding protein, partial [Ornithinibacter sp.]